MLPYLFVILLSVVILHLTQKQKQQNLFLEIIGVLPLVILAGFRDYTIGTDTNGYPVAIFEYCRMSKSLGDALFVVAGDVEPLYVVLEFLISRFTNDAHWLLFWSHFIMFFNIVYASKKFELSIDIAIFLYFCAFFNFSLNGARQSIAITFVPLILYYCINAKYIKMGILFICAFLFHSSVLLCLAILALFIYTIKFPNMANKKLIKVLTVFVVVVMLINFNSLLNYVAGLGAVRTEYSDRYGSNDMYGSNLPISNIYLNIVNLAVFYSCRDKKDPLSCFMEYIAIISVILCGSALISTFLVRITHYFVIVILLYNVKLICLRGNFHKNVSLFLYFLYWFIITFINLEDTTPYKSKILLSLF